MEIVERSNAVLKSLACLKEDLELYNKRKDDQYKNIEHTLLRGTIQSFEFSYDTFWKYIKDILTISYSVELQAPTPKLVFREALASGLITEKELKHLNQLVADRNLTSHTYNEQLAKEIGEKLPDYYALMKSIFQRTIDQQK